MRGRSDGVLLFVCLLILVLFCVFFSPQLQLVCLGMLLM